jgi:uridine kinase
MTIDPGGVTIIDGITSTRRELSGYYDLRIWFSCPRDIRISRLIHRGDTPTGEIERWLPSELHYISSHDPESRAHLVINAASDISREDVRWMVHQALAATEHRITTQWSGPGMLGEE